MAVFTSAASSARVSLRQRLFDRVMRVAPEAEPVRLHWRRVYILPTRAGFGVAVLVLVMWITCVNYGLGLGYLFVFLLFQMIWAGMWGAWDALRRIEVHAGRNAPVFVGDVAALHWRLTGQPAQPPVHVRAGEEAVTVEFDDSGQGDCILRVPAMRRGWLRAGRMTVETRWPLGLWRAWSVLRPQAACLVYPQPEANAPPPPPHAGEGGARARDAARAGTEDFAGFRPYEPGHSPRHVAWKAVARGAPMLSKQFVDETRSQPWQLDWADTAALAETERRLSRLTAWVLRADSEGRPFSLTLPGASLARGQGAAHREQALTLLATYGLAEHTAGQGGAA